jgi:hypothetical protein
MGASNGEASSNYETMTVISFPIPPFQNLPIQAENYQPSRFAISAIALGPTTTITTTEDMNYVIGQLVRLIIPPSFGCRQLNQVEGYVINIPNLNQVILDINSSLSDPYIASTATTVAQIIAVGDINTGVISSTGRAISTTNGNTHTAVPGSFINISPI